MEHWEKTGIVSGQFTEVWTTLHHGWHSLYYEYLYVTGCKKDSITLQEGETQAFKWVDRDTPANLPKQELATSRILLFFDELQ